MKPIAHAIAAWRPQAAEGDALGALQSRWSAIVGPEVAANSRPAEVDARSLLVVTRSSAWSQQLAFLSETILEAVENATGSRPERLRFRVGRIGTAAPGRPAPRNRKRAAPQPSPAPETATLAEAVERFRAGVERQRRAKRTAGLKECPQCGVPALPVSEALCAPCANARIQERHARVARLLFEVPFIGFEGIAEQVPGLTRGEYEIVRRRMLARWWDGLMRRSREGGSPSTHERSVASSFLLVKTQLSPERLTPAVIRNELGDRLTDIFYGNRETN